MKLSRLSVLMMIVLIAATAAFADDDAKKSTATNNAIDDVITDAEPADVIDTATIAAQKPADAVVQSNIIANYYKLGAMMTNNATDDLMNANAGSAGAIATPNSGKRSDVIPLVATLRQGYHYLL